MRVGHGDARGATRAKGRAVEFKGVSSTPLLPAPRLSGSKKTARN